MKTLERSSVREISTDMMEALKAVALKHGIQFTYKGGNFTSTNCTYKIEAAIIGEGGVVGTKEREEYSLFCSQFDLKPEWMDKSFVHGHNTFTIIGLNSRKNNPVICQKIGTDKKYAYPVNLVKILMVNSQLTTA